MTKVYVSSVIPAPPAEVWAVVRDFNALPNWTPFVAESRIEQHMRGLAEIVPVLGVERIGHCVVSWFPAEHRAAAAPCKPGSGNPWQSTRRERPRIRVRGAMRRVRRGGARKKG